MNDMSTRTERQLFPEEREDRQVREVPEDTFIEVQTLVFATLLGDGNPEDVDVVVLKEWLEVPMNAEFSRSVIKEHMGLAEWENLDEDGRKECIKEMAKKLLVGIGGSTTEQ